VVKIGSEEIVVGDYIVVEEGELIPADGEIIQSNDFAVNESIITGESFAVYKSSDSANKNVFEGTLVVSGLAICVVDAIGSKTQIGKIGKSLDELDDEKSPLQIQVTDFVKKMAIAGGAIFLVIWAINYFNSREILGSLLKALTLAMSILPEEIPVAFASFMALGAWRLMKLGIIVKKTRTVETLGSANVICVDKTGTITKNEMRLAKIYVHADKTLHDPDRTNTIRDVITYGMWASEPIPFDPMEKALHDAYSRIIERDLRQSYKMAHEYPLGGQPPLMTHIFKNAEGDQIIAAKGAPEAILKLSTLSQQEKEKTIEIFHGLAQEGYRVLGVGKGNNNAATFPKFQEELQLTFLGLVAFYDPPKDNIKSALKSFYDAGISIKIITGDNATTTKTIANQINFKGDTSITG
jgi:Ca2+-transporting ATPase